MDTLFTTFLSSGMAPSAWPLQDTLLGNCLVDLTNWSSNKSDGMNNHSKVVSGDQFVKRLSKKRGTDCWNPLSDMYYETPYIMYFQTFTNQINTLGKKSEFFDIPFSKYFSHQIHHIAVNRRMQTALQAIFNCCLQFGTSECSHIEETNHCCCKMEEGCNMAPVNQDTEIIEACPCDKLEEGDRYCESHDVFIQDMETRPSACAWNIYFSACAVKEQDDYFVNPCYDELCENLLDDSFEIEFATTTADEMESSFDSIDFTNVHFASFDSGGGCDEFFDVYDEDEDCDDFDEVSCCEIFNSELHLSPTWSNEIIISRTSSRQMNLARSKKDYIGVSRVASQYHTQCTSHACDVVDNYKRNVDTTDCKAKKRVHFPEPERLVTIHHLVAWSHAYKESRKSIWSKFAQDRAHFRRRIMKLSDIIEPVLQQKLSQFDRNS